MGGIDFSAIKPHEDQTCAKCRQEYSGRPGVAKCQECEFYEDHPEEAPGYFCWRDTADGWMAQARWKEHDSLPEPGDTVTVHRRDGSQQDKRVAEIRSQSYTPSGEMIVICQVE